MDIKADMVQDSVGQLCPMPIAFMAKNIKKLEPGEIIEIQADDEGAHADIPAWCEKCGQEFIGMEEEEDCYKLYIRKTK